MIDCARANSLEKSRSWLPPQQSALFMMSSITWLRLFTVGNRCGSPLEDRRKMFGVSRSLVCDLCICACAGRVEFATSAVCMIESCHSASDSSSGGGLMGSKSKAGCVYPLPTIMAALTYGFCDITDSAVLGVNFSPLARTMVSSMRPLYIQRSGFEG